MSAPGSQNWRRSHNRENSFQYKFISHNSDWTFTLLNCTRTQPTLPSFPKTISNLSYFPKPCFIAPHPLLSADDLNSWLATFQSGNPPQAHGCSPLLSPTESIPMPTPLTSQGGPPSAAAPYLSLSPPLPGCSTPSQQLLNINCWL